MREIKVVKIGGKVAENEELLDAFLNEFISLKGLKLLVHGGGVVASKIAEKLGMKVKMIEGRRVTDKQMLFVATMVYAGLVNKNIVAKLQGLGMNAIGLTGSDLNVIQSIKRNPEPIDFGFVGDIEKVNGDWLKVFMEQGIIPVLAPLTHDGKGNLLNTNADAIASHIASSLANSASTELILGFEQPGVLESGKVIPQIDLQRYNELKKAEIVKDGMIPKLDLGFQALNSGVKRVRITNFASISDESKGTILVQ